ncbi:MAG: DUF6527 family protein [Thermoanaerobaculia bacterium]
MNLEPAWLVTAEGNRRGMGISFLCPVHGNNGPNRMPCYLGLWLENPLDGGPPYKPGDTYRPRPGQETGTEPLWRREGETFDTLTLTPSINAEGHWHGFIRNGEVT